MALNPNKLFIRVGAGSITTGKVTVSDVLEKSQTEGNTTKVFFIADTNQIVVNGVAYGLSTDTAAEITKIKSILATYFADGTEDNVKAAIDAVVKTVADNKADIESKAVGAVAYDADSTSIKFTSVDGTELGSVKASDIIGNHVVKASAYDADTNILTLTFEGAATDLDVEIDLGQMLDFNDVVSGDAKHFEVSYAEKKLTIKPVVGQLAGDAATPGLADAEDVRAYIDAAITAANKALDDYKNKTDGRLATLEGDGEGSVAKALADAKAYTDTEVGKEADRAKAAEAQSLADAKAYTDDETTRATRAEKTLTDALKEEVGRADAAEKANAADITAINNALGSADTFWDDYKA